MGKYLKMADVFGLPVSDEVYMVDFAVISDSNDHVIGGFGIEGMSHHAAHAINSHDELVTEVERLRGALHDAATSLETIHIRSFGEESLLDSKPQMRSFAGARAKVAREALAE